MFCCLILLRPALCMMDGAVESGEVWECKWNQKLHTDELYVMGSAVIKKPMYGPAGQL